MSTKKPKLKRPAGETGATFRREELLYRQIVDNSSDCVKTVSIDGVIISINSGGCRTLEIDDPNSLVGRRWIELWETKYHRLIEQSMEEARKGAVSRFQGFAPSAKGKPMWWDVVVSPVYDDAGRLEMLLSVSRDITEQFKAAQAAEAARREAESANRLKDEFLAIVSHELRTPLNSILGWTTAVKHRNFDPELVTRAFTVIERSARKQNEIISDILDVSRITAGKMTLEMRPTKIIPQVLEAIESVREAAHAKNFMIRTSFEPEKAPLICDPRRLQQILTNLLSNAVKFTPPGGSINLSVTYPDESVEFVVADNGCGISPDFLPYVFDRFRQADASRNRRHSGLGLGLSIVRHLVELHGGTITARSDGHGKGSVFTVRLPLDNSAEAGEALSRSEEPLTASPYRLPAGLKILVVDDSPETLELLGFILRSEGAEVFVADSAREALRIYDERPIDLVISDIGMPEQNGFELLGELHTRMKRGKRDIPVLALTAYAGVDHGAELLNAGFRDFLWKPVDRSELVEKIVTILPE